MLLIKATSSGALGWERQFGNSVDISGAGDYPTDAGFCVRTTTDGGFVFAGYVEGGAAGSNIYGHDGVLAKFNNTGTLQWNVRFGTSGTGNEDHPAHVSQTTDGGFIITGKVPVQERAALMIFTLLSEHHRGVLHGREEFILLNGMKDILLTKLQMEDILSLEKAEPRQSLI